jgi:hypothetical protein
MIIYKVIYKDSDCLLPYYFYSLTTPLWCPSPSPEDYEFIKEIEINLKNKEVK